MALLRPRTPSGSRRRRYIGTHVRQGYFALVRSKQGSGTFRLGLWLRAGGRRGTTICAVPDFPFWVAGLVFRALLGNAHGGDDSNGADTDGRSIAENEKQPILSCPAPFSCSSA